MNIKIYSLLGAIVITSFQIIFAKDPNHQLLNQQTVKLRNVKNIKISNSILKFEKLKPIKFTPFSFDYFNIKPNEVVKLKNGKTLDANKFLEEVNEIEKKLNEWGYSLKDNRREIMFGEINYPYELLDQQNKLLDVSKSNILPDNLQIHPCGVLSDDDLKSAIKSGTPKEPWPIKHNKDWQVTFGDENFGFEIVSNFDLNAEEKNNNLYATSSSNIEINIKILSETINAVNLKDRVFNNPFQNNIVLYLLNQKAVDDNIINKAKKNYYKNFEWETGIEFSLGPFSVEGSLNLNGGVGIVKSFNPSSLKLEDNLTPYVNLDLSGKLDVDFEIAEAGINGYIKFIKDTLSLMRELELKNPNLEGGYFVYNTRTNNKIMEALKGKIYAYIDIDYLVDTKKFVFVFYNNERGMSSNQNILTLNVSQPARRDRELYLEILNINGITNYTARNEKNNVVPVSFEVSVDAGGQSFTEKISDWNNDGKIETPVKFKIPLLSSLSIPIKLSVREKYKIGKLQFDTPLDLVKGEEKELTFCYNPISRKIFGSVEGQEEQEIIASGDNNYFGERNHSIKFKLLPHMPFKPAPGKAR